MAGPGLSFKRCSISQIFALLEFDSINIQFILSLLILNKLLWNVRASLEIQAFFSDGFISSRFKSD